MLLSPFFNVLTLEEHATATKASTLKSIKRGKTLWRTGERVEHVAIVRSGLLSVTLEMGSDNDALCGVFRKDDTLLMGLESGLPCPMTIKALTPVDVAMVPMAVLGPTLRSNPLAVSFAYRHCIERLYAQRFMSAVLLNASIERRLAYAYWSMATVDREGRRVIETKVSQADIAKLIGTSREEVSRRSNLLEQSQYLSVEDGVLVLNESLPLLILSETEVPSFLATELGFN